jgi:hypothetical protein
LAAQNEPTKPELADIKSSSLGADANELLAVQCFGFAPQASVSSTYGASNVLETAPSKPSLPACFKMSSPSPVSWRPLLKAGLVRNQWLEQRFAPNQRQARDVPSANVQEIESVIDEVHAALPVGRRLRLCKARPSSVVDAA